MIPLHGSEKVVCVILSGGLSSRMKFHKALLKFSDDQNFLQHIIEIYQKAGIHNIVVVKNTNIDIADMEIDHSKVCVVDNYYPDRGRLYSIQLGLGKSQGADYCFIQNIDNPLISVDLIKNLIALKSSADYISPEYNNIGGHPIVISSPVIKNILTLSDYKNTLRDVLQPYSRHKLITEDANCILNINLPSDYKKVILGMNKTHTFS